MRRNEQGFTTVFIALALVSLLGASAFALDLGQAYTSRRQMQNAADAGALAGTATLLKARNALTGAFLDSSNSVWTAARNTATQNGADVNQVTCKVIRRDQSEIANCSPSIGWILDGLLGGPAGVKVTTGITNLTAFGKVLNTSSLTARATAAAQVKPLVSAKGAPFIVCGVGDHTLSKTQWTQDQTNGVSNNPDLLSLPINLLLPSGAVNPLAVGHIYGLQGSGSTISDCGIESAFDGKSANGNTGIPIPSWQTGTNGNGNDSAVFDTVAGAKPCDGATGFNNCDLVLPLADSGASGYQLHVVALAVFHVTGTGSGNPKYAGRLLTTTAPVTRGEGGSGSCGLGQACVIKMVR